jgi:hypothetical protein
MLRLRSVTQLLERTRRLTLLRNEERLADQIAATLLIPDSWVEAMRRSFGGLAEVILISKQAAVSPELLIRRMAASQFDVAMLRWGREKFRWAVLDRPGAPSALYGCLRPSFSGQWALENVEDEESDLVVDCYLDDRRIGIAGIGVRTEGAVLQLLRPSQSILLAERTAVDGFREGIAAVMGA